MRHIDPAALLALMHSPSRGVTATAATEPATQPDMKEWAKEAFPAGSLTPRLFRLANRGK